MKVRTYLLDYLENEAELATCLDAMKEELFDTLLVTVYGILLDKADMERLAVAVRKVFPKAYVAGGSVDAIISGGRGWSNGVCITFMEFHTADICLLTLPIVDEDVEQSAFQDWFKSLTEPAGMLAVWAGQVNTLEKVFADLGVPLFGGMLSGGNNGHKGFVYADGEFLDSGLVCIAFCGRELEIEVKLCNGWHPIGPTFTITAMDGPYIIRELDGRPFMEVYDDFIGTVPGEAFLDKSVYFPLVTHKHDMTLARLILGIREDGAGFFGTSLEVGDTVQLGYCDEAGAVYDTQKAEKEIAAFHPQGLLLFDCLSRWLLLNGEVDDELKNCRKIAPSSGFYSYGELLGDGEKVLSLNMSLVMVSLRERGTEKTQVEDFSPDDIVFSRHQLFLAHLIHLVQKTTRILEKLNNKLGSQVRTDALTGLANRYAFESCIKSYLQDSIVFSIMMMDIDDFKGINDKFGHDVGDAALKDLAKAISGSLRNTDLAGRWGGDEFVVILRNTGTTAAEKVAERIREAVSQCRLPDGSGFTLSIGIARSMPDDDAIIIFRRADRALYKAKGMPGKNNIVIG